VDFINAANGPVKSRDGGWTLDDGILSIEDWRSVRGRVTGGLERI
jgi:hypothetical protein